MKYRLSTILLFTFFITLYVNALKPSTSAIITNGNLSVTVTTSSAGGEYTPRNVVAIWVEDNNGVFVKT